MAYVPRGTAKMGAAARVVLSASIPLACVLAAHDASAVGEESNGFPNWAERVLHEWTNRARVDPQLEMTACGAATCADGACYVPLPPYIWGEHLNHAARFHSDEMKQQGYPLDHYSHCAIVANIDSIYPASCHGAVACACQNACMCSGSPACGAACTGTTPPERLGLFGAGFAFEIIASGSDPDGAFYQWLFEGYGSTTCGYSQGPPTNGHRYALIDGRSGGAGSIGFGCAPGGYSVGDFAGGGAIPKIPSGSHYPRQASSVDAWANWYDAQAPSQALINVDGTCTPMTKARGVTDGNSAYKATLANVSSGCHRYFFSFKDSASAVVTYPTTGSLGIGPSGSCADWDSTRPATGAGCNCTAQCAGKACGDDACGGSCGNCSGSATCQSGACVGGGTDGGKPVGDGGAGDGGGRDGGKGPGADGGSGSSEDGADSGPGNGFADTSGSCQLSGTGSTPLDIGLLGSVVALVLAHARRRQRR